MEHHKYFMDLALGWAQSAQGQTAPNPMVGAIVVKNGMVVGMGAHLKAGEPHAEVYALRMAGDKAKGAILYVTLEPCSHHGRTPPCAEAVIQAGITKVVIATLDPNPLVAGRGMKRLQEAGIEVLLNVKEEESRRLNEVFNKYITTGLPFVTVKTANTIDGKVATEAGSSRWITGEEARGFVHQLRHQNQSILVGINTVIKDDPQLTTRLPQGGRNPIRIIVDSQLRIPLDAQVVVDGQAPTWIYTTHEADFTKKEELERKGVHVFPVSHGPRVHIPSLLVHLGRQQVTSVLVEGGSQINGSFLNSRCIDKLITFIAPKIVGGSQAPTSFGGEGIQKMEEAIELASVQLKQIGQDILIVGYPKWGDEHVYRDH